MSAEALLRTDGLSKDIPLRIRRSGPLAPFADILFPRYKYHRVLDDVDMSIHVGECVGLIGPNGAGKSTLTRILCGIQPATSGTLTALGTQPGRRQMSYLRSIGVVFGQKSSLWWDLPVIDSFKALKRIYCLTDTCFNETLSELLPTLGLADIIDRPVRVLSLGERVKCELVGALLHNPRLLFLDEPTIGLDIISKSQLRNYIRRFARNTGAGVLITSHDVADIERCCDRLILLHEGRIVRNATLQEILERVANLRFVHLVPISRSVSTQDASAIAQQLQRYGRHDGRTEVSILEDGTIQILCPRDLQSKAVEIGQSVLPNSSMEIASPTLEDIFLSWFNDAGQKQVSKRDPRSFKRDACFEDESAAP